MPMVPAPCSPICSSTSAKPPAVPWPPAIDTLPAVIPRSASTPMSRVIPNGIRFCSEMMSTSRISISTSNLPPFLSTLRSLWKPTQVKKASIKTSFSVSSNDTSTWNQPYRAKPSKEKMIPPLTGEGMQNFCRNATLRVRIIPTIKARAPTPAV